MSVALRVLFAGPGVSLQDAGRYGFMRFGVTPAGPMDALAFATANRAVGAAEGATAIEVSLGGLDLAVQGGAVSLAVAGGAFKVTLDSRELSPGCLVRLEPDARLSIRPGPAGSWCYVAVAGTLDIPPMLGSVATHIRSNLGGIDGRGLVAGDVLALRDARVLDPPAAALIAPWLDPPAGPVRVVLGPQDDYFDAQAIAAFLAGPWTISARSDRMAYQLEGEPLTHAKGFNIVSDGIAIGAVQVPGGGQPVVLMADRQPTGGYPKIATVIGADFGRFAQMRPGAQVNFAAVTVAEAVEARRAAAAALASGIALEPLVRTALSSEFLLSINLVDGVTGGDGAEASWPGRARP